MLAGVAAVAASPAAGRGPPRRIHDGRHTAATLTKGPPVETPRLDQIEADTRARLGEARHHHWLGEVAALEESLRHIQTKRAQGAAAPA